jgi:hypothetical protein
MTGQPFLWPPRQHGPSTWAALMAAVALTAALALTQGCATSRPSPTSSSSSLPKTKLTACVVDDFAAECGKVWVPQDWAHPAGPAMALQVVVMPATAARRPAAPLFVLAGAGGQAVGDGAGLIDMSWATQAFAQLNQTMDLVFVEQRGTPGSGLQTCPGLENWLAGPAAIQAAARRCLASVHRDPRYDTTTSAVRDLDQVRKALGYHQINIYGVSYGVTMGLATCSAIAATSAPRCWTAARCCRFPRSSWTPSTPSRPSTSWSAGARPPRPADGTTTRRPTWPPSRPA